MRRQIRAGVPCVLSVEHEGYLPTEFGTLATAADPTSFNVPLFATIEGRVVDPAGKPLAGIQIGSVLTDILVVAKTSEPLRIRPLRGVKGLQVTDAQGKFRLAPLVHLDSRDFANLRDFKVWPLAICFADEASARVFFLRVDVQNARRPYEITLRPGRAVRIPIEHAVVVPNGDLRSQWSLHDLAGATGSDPGIRVMAGRVKHGPSGQESGTADWIDGYLPEGKYRIEVDFADVGAGVHVETATTEIVVPPGEGPLSAAAPHGCPAAPRAFRHARARDRCEGRSDRHAGEARRLPRQGGRTRLLGPLVRALPGGNAAPDDRTNAIEASPS